MRWLVVVAACGGSTSSPVDALSNVTLSRDCPTPTPDCSAGAAGLVGTWTIATACYPEPAVDTACPQILWLVTGIASGTITFDATTMTRTGSTMTDTVGSAPSACDCTMVDSYIKQNVVNATCTDTTDRCSCEGSTTRDPSTTAGYTATGTTITYDDGKSASFCAGASTLTLQNKLPIGDVFEVLTLTR